MKRISFICIFIALGIVARGQQIIAIHFKAGSDKVTRKAHQLLDDVASAIEGTAFTDIKINGYSDRDEDDSAHSLAARRASNVRTYLLRKNINRISLETHAYGKNFPVDSNINDAAYEKNRRVEVVVRMDVDAKDTGEAAHPPAIGQVILFPDLNFTPDGYEFLPGSEGKLSEILNLMTRFPSLQIEIGGHCCCDPDTNSVFTYNLSVQRANAVRKFLVLNGIAESRISIKGYGATKPLVVEKTEEDKIMNRRIDITILNN